MIEMESVKKRGETFVEQSREILKKRRKEIKKRCEASPKETESRNRFLEEVFAR